MRKLLAGLCLILMSQVGFSQVTDQAVIPVSVTLNSILRLTIISGGNIQFVVNTIDQYENGIANSARYTTTFSVASSRIFDVLINSESGSFIGTDDVANVMDLDNVGFVCPTVAGGGTFNADAGDQEGLDQAQFTLITGRPAGGSAVNTFEIQWELGTLAGSMHATSLLSQSLPPDNYITNVFLVVDPQ